ncbi:hypothetical protein A4X09_0g3018 [Tilletia walkeri]|uniref:NADH:flavin oxidoreductase/NADH oxidase N-terminal domain-containing protein n=1 Tax=Tilletia walkeri TaxID=117179 RepID=A0A8X7N8W6_9BASI|nr:hypothetical protein A4X09_0g3018 [Tilletia walkeri]
MAPSTSTQGQGHDPTDPTSLLSEPLTLPHGKPLPNRLTKAAMAEMLGQMGGSPPTPALLNLYKQWAEGGWGMIITGNVAVERSHLGMPFDISLPAAPTPLSPDTSSKRKTKRKVGTAMWPSSNEYARLVSRFKEYADACRPSSSKNDSPPLVVVQLVHAGRQSMRGFGRAPWSAPLAPSPIPMRTTQALGSLGTFVDWLLWSRPLEMSQEQIGDVINQFAASAKLCSDAGFDGVELHASHGYLLSAFLSPRTNTRTDQYGGSSAENRIRILLEIVDAVRMRVPESFIIGVKLNSSDYIAGGLTEDDALENVRMLSAHGGVDFVEISGGNYENPSFMGESFDSEAEKAKVFGGHIPSSDQEAQQGIQEQRQEVAEGSGKRRKKREAFFLSFASRARDISSDASPSHAKAPMRIIVTGGLRTRSGMAECVAQGGADGVGLGRASAMDPHLPLKILDRDAKGEAGNEVGVRKYDVPGAGFLSKIPIQVVGAGWTTLWYTVMLHWLAHASPSSGLKPATRSQPINAGPLRAALIVAFGSWAVPKEKED